MPASQSGKLRAQNVNLLDDRWFGEHVRRLSHQRFGDCTIQVSLTSALVGKRVTELYSKSADVLTDDFAPADLYRVTTIGVPERQ